MKLNENHRGWRRATSLRTLSLRALLFAAAPPALALLTAAPALAQEQQFTFSFSIEQARCRLEHE